MRKKQKREISSKKGAVEKVAAWLETNEEPNVVEEHEKTSTMDLPSNNINNLSVAEKDGEDDEAPADISWKKSKEEIIKEKKKQDEILLAAKQQEKEARRLRDERMKQQKKEKEERMLSRLPDDVLQAVAEKQGEKISLEKELDRGNRLSLDEEVDSASENSEQESEDTSRAEDKSSKQKGIKVSVLKKEPQGKRISSEATNFLQHHFYGDRLHRVSAVKSFSQKRTKTELEPPKKIAKTNK